MSEDKPTLQDCKDFASDIMMMKHRAAKLGMWKTMHALEPVTKAVGYEMAEMLEGKHPTSVDSEGVLQVIGVVKPG